MAEEKNKVNQFFYRLVQYGGVSADPGTIYVWGDPNLLIPYESFTRLEEGLIRNLKEDGKKIMLWFGHISGYQATDVLTRRFGIPLENIWEEDHKDVDEIINGGTQDGFGYFKGSAYTPKGDLVKQQLIVENATIGKKYAEIFGKQKEGCDIYSMGVTLGGMEFIYKTKLAISETTCVAKGDKKCTFDFHEDKKTDHFSKLFKKAKVNQSKIEAAMISLYLKRPARGSFVMSNELKFGDGNFIYHGQPGVVVATRAFVPSIEMAKALMSEKSYNELLNDFAKGYAVDTLKGIAIKGIPNSTQINAVIKRLNLFGLGEFSLLNGNGRDIFIENKTNPIVRDYVSIFGFKNKQFDEVICAILRSVFEKLYNAKMSVEESECVAEGKRRCLFKITRK
jgi:predicted hydrocarbon binding protein